MKHKYYKNPLKLILSSFSIYKWVVLFILVAILLKQFSAYKVLVLQKDIVNIFELSDISSQSGLFMYLAKHFIFFFTMLIVITGCEHILIHYLSMKVSVYAIKCAILNVQDQDYSFFKTRHQGMLNAYLSDLSNMKSIIKSVFYSFSQFWSISVSIFVIFQINLNLSIFIVCWSLVTSVIFHYFNVNSSYLSRKFSKSKAKINGYFSDFANNFITFITSTKKHKEESILDNIISAVNKRYNRIILLNMLKNFSIAVCMLFFNGYIFYILFKYKIESNILHIGEITTILGTSVKLFWDLSTMIKQTSVLSEEYGLLLQATKHLFFSNYTEDENRKNLIASRSPKIEFRSVSFAHDEESVFKNFSLKINSGEKIGIVGKTGSGKTTLVYLLLKILSPQKGKILIDDQVINRLSKQSVRNAIAFVSQNVEILSRSLKDNMLLSVHDDNCTKEYFQEVASQSLCDEFAEMLGDKYLTKLGEKGAKLSGGQKQRISIARALFKGASIIIFDEATSALDNITEKAIQKNLETSFKDKTCIFIAHRLSTLKNMDRIIVMDKGCVVEAGTHKELLANKKYYHKLWTSND